MPRDLYSEAMSGVLACVRDALIEADRDVSLAHLAPGGEVAWDACCDGQLWVRLIDVYPTNPFPTEDTQQLRCTIVELAARIGVGVMRCAHTVDDNGRPPTAAEMTADTVETTADATIVSSALMCCTPNLPIIRSIKLGHWTPAGPQGGCVGGEWQALIALDWCGC